jgi:hypothetical protein
MKAPDGQLAAEVRSKVGFEQPIDRSYWAQRTNYWTNLVMAAKFGDVNLP